MGFVRINFFSRRQVPGASRIADNKHLRRLVLLGLLGIAGIMMARAGVPSTVLIQGKLTDTAGNALTGTRAWRVQFYDAASGGMALGPALTGNLTVSSTGRWIISLTPPAEVISPAGEVWYEL